MAWDLLDEDCAVIADWVDEDSDVGVSEVSPAGQFRLDTNAGAAGNAGAQRRRVLTSPPDRFTIEIKTYFDDIGDHTVADDFQFYYATATWRLNVLFSSTGLFVAKASQVYVEVGTNIVKEAGAAAWQTWRFEVNKSGGEAAAIVEVFLDEVSQGTVDCDWEAGLTDGTFVIVQRGHATDNMVSHLDYVRAKTGFPLRISVSECTDLEDKMGG